MSWEDKATCKGMNTWLFFGPDSEAGTQRNAREARAKAVCAACPVRARCLDYALGESIRHGIWGGLNEEERARERRRQTRAPRIA